MLGQLYNTIKYQLLAVEGMTSQPYETKTGNGPKGGIEEFTLRDRNFAGLRLTDKCLMLYLSPLLAQDDLDWIAHRLR